LFGSRWAAEQIFDQRGELPFHAEWSDQKAVSAGSSSGLMPAAGTEVSVEDSVTTTVDETAPAAPAAEKPDADAEAEEEATWAEDGSEHGDAEPAKGEQ